MSEFLYVCHFSNGHIKVGRSISPKSRVASHADRVACVGIELIEHHIVECVGHSAPAEAALIERCTELATKRNKSEWFEGLEYVDVCDWASEFSKQVFEYSTRPKAYIDRTTGIALALEKFENSPTKLAQAVGGSVVRQHVEHWLKVKKVPADKAPDVMAATGVAVDLLCPETNWRAVREMAVI